MGQGLGEGGRELEISRQDDLSITVCEEYFYFFYLLLWDSYMLPKEQIDLTEFIDVKGQKAKGNKLSYSKVKTIDLLPPEEVPIEEEVLDEFEETGMSPLEAVKKKQEPKAKTEKNAVSIDQQLNADIKLPSQKKKRKTKKKKGDGDDQTSLKL